MKNFLLLCILSIFSLSLTYGQGDESWYGNKWESVKLINMRSVKQSDIRFVEDIYTRSLEDGNQLQQLKSFDYLISLKTQINWNEKDMLLDSLLNMRSNFTQKESYALYRIVVAEYLINRIRYSIKKGNSTITNDYKSQSISEWNNYEIISFLEDIIREVISKSDNFKELPANPFNMIIPLTYNKDILSPNYQIYTLRLAKDILSKRRNNLNRLYLEVTDKLLEVSRDYPEVYISTFISQHKTSSSYLEKLEELIQEFKESDAVVIAKGEQLNVMSAKYGSKVNDNYYQEIYDSCDQILHNYPKSKYLTPVRHLQKRLKTKTAYLDLDKQFYPENEKELKLTYKNLSELKIKVYQLNDTTDNWGVYSNEYHAKNLLEGKNVKPVDTYKLKLDAPLYINKYKYINFKAPKKGNYLICFYDEKDSILNVGRFAVSNVAAIFSNSKTDKYIYVADLKSGKPYTNVTLEAKTSTKSSGSYIEKLKLNNFTPYLKELNDNRFSVRVYTEKDKFSLPTPIFFSKQTEEEPERFQMSIYTDRIRYRYQDTIKFRVYYYNIGEEARMREGESLSFNLKTLDGKTIAKTPMIKSDEWGGVTGSFVVPAEATAGRYMIDAMNTNFIYGNRHVYIGDFNENHYEIVMTAERKDVYINGERVKINGKVISYGGYSLGELMLDLNVRMVNQDDYLVEKSIVCDSTGNFSFEFDTSAKEKHNSYIITATTSSKTGETLSKSISVSTSDKRYYLSSNLTSPFTKEENPKLIVKANSNRETFDGIQGEYRILTTDSVEVISGNFRSSTPIDIDWNRLKSGSYIVCLKADEASESRINYIIFSKEDKVSPEQNERVPFFFYPLNEKVKRGEDMKFMLGTTKDKIYTLIRLTDDKGREVYQRPIVLSKGMNEYSVPYLDEYRSNLNFVIFAVYDGDYTKKVCSYKRALEDKNLKMKFISLRDKGKPGEKESFYIEVSDNDGTVSDANIVLTAFNKASSVPYNFSYSKLMPYDFYGYHAPFSQGSAFGSIYLPMDFSRRYYEIGDAQNELIDNSMPVYRAESSDDVISVGYETKEDREKINSFTMDSGDDNIKRDDFRLTAAFKTDLVTDKDGRALVEFYYPDALATYNIYAAAVTKDVRSALCSDEVVITKDVMITALVPQFIRGGDKLVIKSQLINKTDKEITANVIAKSEKGVVNVSKPTKIVLSPNSSEIYEFELATSNNLDMVDLRVELDSDSHKDIEVHSIPVIAAVGLQEENKTYCITNNRLNLNLKSLVGDKKRANESLNVTLFAPRTMILLSLPDMIGSKESKSAISLIDRWHSLGVARMISYSCRGIIQSWDKSSESSDLSVAPNLELTANETPWRINSPENRLESLKMLCATGDTIHGIQADILSKISNMQNTDGGYPWFKGMRSSPEITMLMLESFSSLVECKYYTESEKITHIRYVSAMKYLDRNAAAILSNNKTELYPNSFLNYLYIRSLYNGKIVIADEYSNMINEAILKLQDSWKSYSLLDKVLIASFMNNIGRDVTDIIASIKEYGVKDGDNGTYFPNLVMPFRGMVYSEIRAHAMILKLLQDIPNREYVLEHDLAKWLIMQRKRQLWSDNSASIFAINAMWKYYNNRETTPGRVALLPTIKGSVLPETTSTKGRRFNVDKLRAGNTDYYVSTVGNGDVIVDIEYSYEQPLSQMKPVGNGFSVERRMYRVDGTELKLVDKSNRLKIGDEVAVRYFINCKNNSSFVQLKATRTGALKPVKDFSGYENNYYKEVKKNESIFSFYLLAEGNHIVEERFFVDYAGDFNDGYVKINSLFNPIINANSPSKQIEIQNK